VGNDEKKNNGVTPLEILLEEDFSHQRRWREFEGGGGDRHSPSISVGAAPKVSGAKERMGANDIKTGGACLPKGNSSRGGENQGPVL